MFILHYTGGYWAIENDEAFFHPDHECQHDLIILRYHTASHTGDTDWDLHLRCTWHVLCCCVLCIRGRSRTETAYGLDALAKYGYMQSDVLSCQNAHP